ncbi:hypothetical protein HKD37_16G045668 [Glycine soja]
MKANMEAMKEQMTTMMEAKMSMGKMMEVNTAIVVAASTAIEVYPTHPSILNQVNHPVSDMVGKGGEALGSMGDPYFVQVQSKHPFPPFGLPPNYTPPNVVHAPDENVDNSAPIPIENQQAESGYAQVPQPMGETHEVPQDHILADFEPCLGYATEGQAFGGIPLPNTLGGSQYRPQSFHFAVERLPPAMEHESFKGYAQRWRDLAAQVMPPMMEREMITMIVDTLLVFYYEKMVGYTLSSFSDLVFVDERIKVGLRRGKFDYLALINRKPGANGENKEGETHGLTIVPTWSNFPLAQQYQYSANISPSHYPPPYQPRTPNHP